MSTRYETFCNTTTDLMFEVPSVDQYDRKRVLQGWEDEGVLTKVYVVFDSGYVSAFYTNGEDLGDPEANLIDLTADGDWYFDGDSDAVYMYSSQDPANHHCTCAGRKWVDLKAEAVARAADFVRSYLAKPLYKRVGKGLQSESLRDWDDVLIRANALLACSYLMRPYDFDQARRLEGLVYSAEYGAGKFEAGLLDRIKSGDIALWHEVTPQKGAGIVREVSLDATTTGGLVDTKGDPSTDWDIFKVVIETGGTFSAGATSTVTFSTYVRDAEGLKLQKVVDTKLMNGGYQGLAHNIYGRFSLGTYVADDEWEIEVSGDASEAGTQTRTLPLRRV